MVLSVPFEGFVSAYRTLGASGAAFVAPLGAGTVVTAREPKAGAIVRSVTDLALPEAKAALTSAGLQVEEGQWGETAEQTRPFWVAAVAYKSNEDSPGLWVDTYESKPTTGQVLAELYEEFRETGEVGEVSMEEFVRQADPNVVVLSPEEQAEFARRSHGCEG